MAPAFRALASGPALAWLGVAALLAAAALTTAYRTELLLTLMLFYPWVDAAWRPPGWPQGRARWGMWLLLAVTAGVLIKHPEHLGYALSNLLFAALPEEWFFRGYLQARWGNTLRATVISSICFAVLHGITRGWELAAWVFLPSLGFGLLYRYTRDLATVVLAHLLSNLLYVAGLGAWHAALRDGFYGLW